ncbi:hypothetical protein PROFUN_01487 [Planoprotostelium fungivorum]|uniref:Uncharacterized protein n=1 Tax=Planoprotostelium fungivorum TaxID=1890364 RepID=A0A2P6NTC4_9EUKA|nr:hypothetical protein PROFUN_01487 [Planoprotostelium fungivorum]
MSGAAANAASKVAGAAAEGAAKAVTSVAASKPTLLYPALLTLSFVVGIDYGYLRDSAIQKKYNTGTYGAQSIYKEYLKLKTQLHGEEKKPQENLNFFSEESHDAKH